MEHTDPIVRTTDLTVGYGHRVVLEEVTLEVRRGEFWFFLGPNGSGKTTLVRAILGVIRSRAGAVWLHPERARREQIGFVPQRCDINPTLPTTVREFVLLGLVGLRVDRHDRALRLRRALGRTGLSGLDEQNYWSLSVGQRQRALVARALVREPGLLILDEPTSSLDLAAEDAFLRLLADLNRAEGLTILFVTHDLAIAARYATHLALFHSGRVETGPREKALNRVTLERIYGATVEVSRDPSGAVAVRVGDADGDP
jgi:ABC-type Mn2+/Zn2+ transport system ATPase subunit